MTHTFQKDDDGWIWNPNAPLAEHPWPIWRYIGYPNTGHEALIAKDGSVLKTRLAQDHIHCAFIAAF